MVQLVLLDTILKLICQPTFIHVCLIVPPDKSLYASAIHPSSRDLQIPPNSTRMSDFLQIYIYICQSDLITFVIPFTVSYLIWYGILKL